MSNLLLSIIDGTVTFGGKPTFEDLSLNIHQNDRICLVGKNGSGKTTLMHIISGAREIDRGKKILNPSVKIGYLEQQVDFDKNSTIFEFIYNILPKEKQNEENTYLIEMMCGPLELNSADKMGQLSGGQLRRAALARALVEEPDILLLDEPTNHLDISGIEWLENYLRMYRGAFLCVSHDKAFLKNISNKIFWLDRGKIKVAPRGFEYFDEWSEMLLDQERRELERRNKIISEEIEWATKGIKARRKRNVRRVENIKKARDKLRQDLSNYRRAVKKIEIDVPETELATNVVAEFYNASKIFDDGTSKKVILDKFSLKILKGERVGILGKNGSGKTSFLKLLLGQIKPDTGTVKLAKTTEVSYFDRQREGLKNDNTLWRTLVPAGGDFVNVGGKLLHVCGYLKKFMFDPKDANNLVGTLSGGQKNRLMLAKSLANPGNFLILDEPTNDLDMDTLEMLEEILSKYNGTLFVVSHDRDFLDQIVTRIIAFEGNGIVHEHIGGYSDFLEFRKSEEKKKIREKNAVNPLSHSKGRDKSEGVERDWNIEQDIHSLSPQPFSPLIEGERGLQNKPKKLTYKLQWELDNLPSKIEELENKIAELQALLADPATYSENPAVFFNASEEIGKIQKELEAAETRWLELEDIVKNNQGQG